jgi:fumarate reductase subunit D
VPYHLGTGWFGGFLPLIATAVTASDWAKHQFGAGAMFAGLMYPVAVCIMTLIVGALCIRETKDHRIDTDIHPFG